MSKTSAKARVRARSLLGLLASASIVAIAAMAPSPAAALVVRDDVGVEGAVDVDNEWGGVGQMFARRLNPDGTVSTFLCTGTLINPRTVVFAQHCNASIADGAFDPGAGSHMGFGFDPTDTFTGFDLWRRGGDLANPISDPLTGSWQSQPDALFYNVLQVRSVFGGAEFFPGGDLTIASFDTPAIGLPTYGMLFSPLTGPAHAALAAYGTNGTGSTGDVGGIDFKRRVGENMIDGLFSQNDWIAAAFAVPGFGFGSADAAQLLYHIDFDKPNRVADDCSRTPILIGPNDLFCETPPYGPVYTIDNTSVVVPSTEINWHGGDALPNEAGTAGGDSGSALFADQIYSRPLITGVLSGGWVNGIAAPFGGYGDIAYYNPLFLFRDWLVENNPYVYASARAGNGNWSNPNHWVQNMDPNYFYIDRTGRVRNGLPAGAEPGYFADDPKWGTVFDTDVSGGYGDEGPDAYLCELDASFPCPPGVALQAELTDRGLVQLGQAEHGIFGPAPTPAAFTASRGAPTGPGSTRFVPNNSYGAYGNWASSADGVARFYDVTLNAIGRTRLDMNVEIDNLTVSGLLTELDVLAGRNLNSLVAVDQFAGFVNVAGTVRTREYMLWGGILTGTGAIHAQSVYNVDGVISGGALDSVGRLTINGDYVQTRAGDMLVNIRRQGSTVTNDFIQVNGDASLRGGVYVAPVNLSSQPRYNDRYTVLNADSVVGNFDNVTLLALTPLLYGDSVVRANGNVDILIKARPLGWFFGAGHVLSSLAQAIDALRWSGRYTAFETLFSTVDTASFDNFERTVFSLAPTYAFETTPLAVQYTQGFMQGLDARTAELRAGVRGLSDRSALAGLRIARAGAGGESTPSSALTNVGGRGAEEQRLGFFVAGHGNLSAVGEQAYEGDRYNPANITAFSSAEMTMGADYRVSENFALGVASTLSRYLSQDSSRGVTPMDHTGYGVVAYATAWEGAWNVDAYAGVARHVYEMSRVPGINLGQEIDANQSALQSLAGVRAGYTFAPIEGLSFGPTLGLSYSSLALEGYREMGVPGLALDIAGRTMTSVTVETALQFAYQPFARGAARGFAAYGRLGYVTELGDGVDLVSASFIGAPDAIFGIERVLETEWVSTAGGFSYQFGPNMSANLEAVADLDRGPLTNTQVRAGFNLRF